MSVLPADYYDGRTSRRHAAELRVDRQGIELRGVFGRRRAPFAQLTISEPMGHAPRTVRFADGAFCEIADTRRFAVLLADAAYRETAAVRMQARWAWAGGALAAVAAFCLFGYFCVLPWAAERLAPRLPPAFSTAISQMALRRMDQRELQASALPPARQQALQERMRALKASVPELPAYQLHFRSSRLPPNAFALPSGDVVIFDSLAAKLSDDEIVAVLAHELGHVHFHHGLRSLVEGAVVASFAAVYFGDVSSLVAVLAAAALQAHYSQAFELEADRYAGQVLLRAHLSPSLLADALAKLDQGGGTNWLLSSHPDSIKRIELLRAMH